jgi:hypothetical protein
MLWNQFFTGVISIAPWVNWRFSVRAVLVVTTLVAVLLGALVALR